MECHHCGSGDWCRNGSYRGVQRYLCRSCGRSFTSRGERFSKAVKARALDMYLNNVGVRKVARFVGASPASVINWIRKARERLIGQLRHAADDLAADGQPDVIEMDEIYTYVQKNTAVPSYGLLIVDGRVALLRITSATRASKAP
jgi:transposase-like protein